MKENDMEEDIRMNGDWYIPETDETIAGTLYINKVQKKILLQLTKVATEDDFIGKIKVHGRTDIIKGSIDTGGTILLYDCLIGGQNNCLGQRTTVSVSVKAAFWNLDIESKEELIFPKVIIDFGEILDWTELCSFNWEVKDDYRDEKLAWNYNSDIEFEINSNTTLRIVPHLGSKSMENITTKKVTIEQAVYMQLEYQKAVCWDDVIKDIQIVSQLLTLGINKAIYIEEIWYLHQSNKDERGFISKRDAFLGDVKAGKHQAGGWMYYLFTLSDLTGNAYHCLKNWYSKYDLLGSIVELYETAYNYPGISSEMLFLNLTQALETYHARFVSNDLKKYIKLVDVFLREIYKLTDDDEFDGHILSYRQVLIAQNEEGVRSITLKSRLGYLFLARFEIIFEYLDYKMDEFIQKVVDTRNYYIHYSIDKKEKIFPKHQMPYVNGILLGVLQYYILKEIGIKDEHIKKAVRQQMAGVSHSYDAIK